MRTRLFLPLTLLALLAASARGQISLFTWQGQPYDNFGVSCARLADLDHDGVSELMVGSTGDDAGCHECGSVTIYSGKTGALIRKITGGTEETAFGLAIADAGDLDGDGDDEVIIGAPYSDEVIGKVYVFSSKDGSVLFTFAGDADADTFGYSVAGAGDVDGDGFADILVGAPGNYLPDARGFARVHSGRTGATLFTLRPDGAVGEMGYAVAACGDVDLDGRADFAASAPIDDQIAHEAGMVRLYSGKDASPIHTWRGSTLEEYFGRALANVGDVDQDGVNDLLIGVPAEHSLARAELRSGKTGATIANLFGGPDHAEYGLVTAGLEDLDGDQRREIAVGAVNDLRIYSGKDLTLLSELNGRSKEGYVLSIASLGDVDGDGLADFAAGFPSDLGNRGTVSVYAGTTCVAARAAVYGSGWPGTFGVPAIAVDQAPSFCQSLKLSFANSRHAATQAVLFGGAQPAALPTEWGGTLLVTPALAVPIALPSSKGFAATLSVPCDASFCGVPLYLQALLADPGASHGVAFTPGLALTLGN
jgi:hypothetical protein